MSQRRSQLSEQQTATFHSQGYLSLERVTTADDVRQIRELLDPLFDRFDSLPRGVAIDLGGGDRSKAPQIPEINSAIRLEPRLRQTVAFSNCREIAGELLGRGAVHFAGDHAIYKPPRSTKPTPWHQDQAYLGHSFVSRAVTFWLPLQDVTVEMGCMRFIPGSHRLGLLPHHPADGTPGGHTLTTTQVDTSLATPCPIPAGGATVHTPLTLHVTGPNQTDSPRRAWIIGFSRDSRYGLMHAVTLAVRYARKVRAAVTR